MHWDCVRPQDRAWVAGDPEFRISVFDGAVTRYADGYALGQAAVDKIDVMFRYQPAPGAGGAAGGTPGRPAALQPGACVWYAARVDERRGGAPNSLGVWMRGVALFLPV